jgi:NAD(P)-dependent dehydrogenase (short-subunit alcohol dehydrogenase family)
VIEPGSGVVVTGAARGIGRAIASRLSEEGMRVVVNDLDADALGHVAEQLGAVAVAGDAASGDGVRRLVDAATQALGRVDVFVANAGIGAGGGLETDDETWDLVLEVNVLSHVRAAGDLVPRWLADGRGGRLVVTASAAGLLTMIGNAPYSVSKHAAVAFAEWLSATYRDRGIVVQALCPQGVRTRMTQDVGALTPLLAGPDALEPDDVAATLWEALHDDRFLVLPHPEVAGFLAAKAAQPDAWLESMNRLQNKLGVPRLGVPDGASGGAR